MAAIILGKIEGEAVVSFAGFFDVNARRREIDNRARIVAIFWNAVRICRIGTIENLLQIGIAVAVAVGKGREIGAGKEFLNRIGNEILILVDEICIVDEA